MTARLRLALLALVAVALGAAPAWRAWQEGTPPDPAEQLARLVPGHRPLLGRTSLATPHAPFDAAVPPVGPKEREAIYARLLAAKVDGAPGAEGALAAFYAKRGEAGDADRALAAAGDPVDRGVVLLALDRPDEALEEFAKSLARRPRDPAALFDRALAVEALLLDHQAAAAWEEFLAVEHDGGWAEEGRRHLAELRAPLPAAKPSPDQQKRKVVLALFDLQRREDLAELRLAAEAVDAAGDPLALRSVQYLERLDDAGWQVHLEELARFAAAREEVGAGRDADRELRQLETSADPVIAVKAASYAAYSALLRGDGASARAALGRIRELCRRIGCVEEAALAVSDLGNLRHRGGDLAGALRSYEEAEKALPATFSFRLGEVLTKQATAALDLGQIDRATKTLARVIRLQHAIEAPELVGSLALWGEVLVARGRPAAAEQVVREELAIGTGQGPEVEARAAEGLADVLAGTGRVGPAIEVLRREEARLGATDLGPIRAECLMRLALLHVRAGEPAEADRAVRAAVEAAAGAVDAQLPETVARVARARGDGDRAIASLRDAVRIDRERTGRVEGPLAVRRMESASAGRRLLLAALLGEADRVAEALEVFAGGQVPAPARDECRIGFAVVEDRLVAFSSSTEGPRFDARPLSAEERRLLTVDAWAGDREAAAKVLGTPWAPGRCPARTDRLAVLEPAGALRAPVAVLAREFRPDAAIGVAVSPASTWPGAIAPAHALAIVAPAVEAEELPSLPSGYRELRSIDARWNATALEGPRATPDALALEAPRADLLHFAVHGISRTGHGAASYLMLAGPEGRVTVQDVLALSLVGKRPLVVLSACRTAGPIEYVEADGGGLPWAFLTAGARAVIAPVGPIEDDVAAAFSEALYAELAAGAPVPRAVARAERAAAGSTRARFVLYF